MVDAGEFYTAWFELEEHRRAVYRDDPREAERQFDLALLQPVIANSAQATTWNLAAKADALIAQGRFDEAFDAAEQGRASSAENELGLIAGLFAAVGAGDTARIRQVRALIVTFGGERVPAGRGYLAAADSLAAALEGRWDDARAALLVAEPVLEAVGEGLMLARFRLALGHLAAGRFPEAATAAEQAERWFADLGAPTYVADYRAAAARGHGADGSPRAATTTGTGSAAPGTPVRSAR